MTENYDKEDKLAISIAEKLSKEILNEMFDKIGTKNIGIEYKHKVMYTVLATLVATYIQASGESKQHTLALLKEFKHTIDKGVNHLIEQYEYENKS